MWVYVWEYLFIVYVGIYCCKLLMNFNVLIRVNHTFNFFLLQGSMQCMYNNSFVGNKDLLNLNLNLNLNLIQKLYWLFLLSEINKMNFHT